ncbi:hypothetical protein [Streptosporangium canum]|uniref:hypothetical protein n=1 Tax=Streptosporangium canum TaxID=324952 RepID=UPI00378E49FB
MDEVTALVDRLRASIATLDTQIEQRAQKVAAEQVREFYAQNARRSHAQPAEDPHPQPAEESSAFYEAVQLLQECRKQLEQVGKLWQQDMIEKSPDGGETFAKIPATAWTSYAAALLAAVCGKACRADEETRDFVAFGFSIGERTTS